MNASTADLSAAQFGAVSTLVHRVCGINLHAGKFELVRARLASRIRELGIPDFDGYFALLDRDATELGRLVDLLTTNKTSFFREPKHFELLRQRVIPELRVPGRPLRVWSAGCSSGEEPYSLAMTLHADLAGDAEPRILATDISARMLAHARRGVYSEETMYEVPATLRQQHFRLVSAGPPRSYAVSDRLRASIRFAQLNLMDRWPMKGPFDLVCCRNVMIYFDKETQQRLVERFWEMITPGGYFFVGHSESFAALSHAFSYVQPAVYRRPA
ncbi:MAG TPA: protein-glutamate O-methyltransferase CheR [Longimicrobiales bacterium]|nr:protein-glutamate O-methyltransferase CheR [Longimicrobiales bacterium]